MKYLLVVALMFYSLILSDVAQSKPKKKKAGGKKAAVTASVESEEATEQEAPAPEAEEESAPEAAAAVNTDAEVHGEVSEEEEVVDLDSLDEEEASPPPPPGDPHAGHGHGAGAHGGGGLKMPKFKLFFDLLVEYEWKTNLYQFTRDHAHVMLEVEATPWLQLRADIAFEPEFFEGIFQLGTVAELRIGKILVPFGQNEWHHLIGGRVDKDGLFLPPVWGEYGLAFKHFAYNGKVVTFDWTLWLVNGFQDSTDKFGNAVPARTDGSLTDNNQMKGIGLRPTLGLGRAVTLGTSWYIDAWDPKNDNWMLVYGVDLELGYGLIPVNVLRDIRIRAEVAWAEIKLDTGQNAYHGIMAGDAFGILPNYGIRRSGYNLELSYRPIKILTIRFREGWLNDDSRVIDQNDLYVHEPGVVVTVGPVQFSLVAQILQRRYSNWEAAIKEDIKANLSDTLSEEDRNAEANEQFKDRNFEYSRLLLRVLYRY